MANVKKARISNIKGNFFVDDTCIDCGTCYWLAPENFTESDGLAAVYKQPENQEEESQSIQALLSCPVGSIGAIEKSYLLKEVKDSYPRLFLDNIYHLGFHSEKSYGATSYYINDEKLKVMVDSPRYLKQIADSLNHLGGVNFQYLTHKDDVADTDKYHEIFNSQRIIHFEDKNKSSANYEIYLKEDKYKLSEDFEIISIPGHTKGHTTLLYKNKYLFTGDHLFWSPKLNQLSAFRNGCWYNWDEQIKSMKRLLDYNFEHILPGHGAPYSAPANKMKIELEKCIKWMSN